MHRTVFAVTLAILMTSCDKDPLLPIITGCAESGTVHTGTHRTGVWSSFQNPHILRDSVVFTERLTITPGVVICAEPNSALTVETGELIAHGTHDMPVVITAQDTVLGWQGISVVFRPGFFLQDTAHASLKHVRMKYGSNLSAMMLDIEDSEFNKVQIRASCRLNMYRSSSDGTLVTIISGVLEDNIIRGGGVRVFRSGNASTLCGPVSLNGGRIENSPGVALNIPINAALQAPRVLSGKPIRIVGSQGNPVNVSLHNFRTIWPTRADQDSLLGNHNDTLLIHADGRGNVVARHEFPWKVSCALPNCTFGVDTLTIEPGGSITIVNGGLQVHGRLNAIGSLAQPIRISSNGLGVFLVGTGRSDLQNAVLTRAYLIAREQHVAALSGIKSTDVISLGVAGSSITDSEISDVVGRGFTTPATAALTLGASGLRAERVVVRRTTGINITGPVTTRLAGIAITGDDVLVQGCEVTDNADDGIRVLSGSNVRINECNIERNGAPGVNNIGAARVDARRNWWGDPVGPLGPNGDGVNGDVDYSQHRTTPIPPVVFRLR